MKDNVISVIDILSHNEHGSSYYMPAMDKVPPEEIIESQSISVDAVNGSTCTSYGIMNAVGDALSDAVESGSLAEIENPELSGKCSGKGMPRGNKHSFYLYIFSIEAWTSSFARNSSKSPTRS
ncbi:MAG: FMN-binding protein [Peptostreptococcaceae bacterium]|nr:FMN-binding protein [Peptostreptococcaceae bacterium]